MSSARQRRAEKSDVDPGTLSDCARLCQCINNVSVSFARLSPSNFLPARLLALGPSLLPCTAPPVPLLDLSRSTCQCCRSLPSNYSPSLPPHHYQLAPSVQPDCRIVYRRCLSLPHSFLCLSPHSSYVYDFVTWLRPEDYTFWSLPVGWVAIMTIFIAALFLPYTINFNVSPTSTRPSSAHTSDSTTNQQEGDEDPPFPGRALSLLRKVSNLSIPPIVQTPGATTDHERIFIVPEHAPFKLHIPEKARKPRLIARGEPHSPAWGRSFTWTQPASRAKSPPPVSVTKHEQARDRTASVLWRAANKYKAQEKARSHERRYSGNNYTVEQAVHGNGGLHNAIQAACDNGLLHEKTWVGTLGMPTDALNQHVKSGIAENLEHDYDSLTVYVHDNDFDGCYSHYCKTILWPIFHYQIPDNPKSKAYEDHSWIYYVKVNEAFAERIAKNWKRGDVIWVHDYHLLLVPGMLRKLLPDAQIGFYLHVAFPSSEIFRCVAVRKQLLEGILGANLIGFQTDEYCHHFLQTCSRLLCVEATKSGVHLEDGRFVHVETFPVGIDPKSLDQRREHADVDNWIKIISDKYKGKRLIVARDKLDNVRGVRQKMLAYELFLNQNPQFQDQVVMIQIATSSNDSSDLDATVADIATRVNSMHSTLAHQPLVFLKQDIAFSQYLALLTVADCLMITSLREGMNLTSHEFVYCQDGKMAENKYGPMILSEFTGSASVFNHHNLLVNPWDYKQCADAIKTALDMNQQQRKTSWHSLYGTVMHHTALHWYQSYTQHLEQAWKEHSTRDSTSIPRLAFGPLSEKYTAAERRLFLIDYEGTLASWGSPSDIVMTTPQRAIDALNDVMEDHRNIVYVMSSRMPEELERLFRLVPGLGLIAENGCFLMEAGSDDWIELTDLEHISDWKSSIKEVLEYYHERIEASRIEERHCALIFDYSQAEDFEVAQKQAGECANHINDSNHKLNVHAIPVEGAIIVTDCNINKASAATMISEKNGQA